MINWFKNLFKSRQEDVSEDVTTLPPTTYVFPTDPVVLKKSIVVGEWRTGMWVIYNKMVAILHKIVDFSGEVHIVDEQGNTVKEVLVPLDALRQAKYDEIPPARRGSFDREVARSMGYGD